MLSGSFKASYMFGFEDDRLCDKLQVAVDDHHSIMDIWRVIERCVPAIRESIGPDSPSIA